MDIGEIGRIAVCCRVRPPETTDSSNSSSISNTSNTSDTSQSREGSRASSRGSTPIEIDHRCVRLKPEYAALAEHTINSSTSNSGGGVGGSTADDAVAAGRLSAGARGGRRRRGSWGFTFDDVMEEGCRQDEVYRRCAKCIVDSVLVGLNGTVMAYGCTGAGKSYTMMGERGGGDKRSRGICARALQDILREATSTRRRNDEVFTIQMSFVEIYNEQLFDLLQPEMCPSQRRFSVYGGSDGAVGKRSAAPAVHVPGEQTTIGGGGGSRVPTRENTPQQPDLAIYERRDGSTYVKGLSLLPVSTEEEAMRMLRIGQTAREVAENQFNHASSRSHAVLTVHITVRKKTFGELGTAKVEGERERGGRGGEGRWGGGGVTTSKLNLVDLAGSEKGTAGASAGGAATLHREGCYINKSLTFLEQVTIALADKTREHVPFRQSKLTHLLKDSLGGNCRTLLVACVWPRPELLVQSLATLKFAARMRCIKNEPVVNEQPCSMDEELTRLRRQVRQLKAEVALKDDLGFSAISPTQRRCIWEEAGRFVLEGSKRVFMRAGTEIIKARERGRGEGGEQGETDSEDGGGSEDASDVLHRDFSAPPDTTIITDGSHGDTGAAQERNVTDEGNFSERMDEGQERGVICEGRRRIRRNSLSGTPPASASASVSVSVSSPPERQERLLPSLSTARHAHELCLALREFVWEAAVATTTTTTEESRERSRRRTTTTTNNNNNDNNNDNSNNTDDDVCDKGEHENTSGDAKFSGKTADDKKGVYWSTAAAATVRSAIHAAVEGSNSSIAQQESRQQGRGGEHRRLKKRGRRRRPPAAHSAAEEAEGWVPRRRCLRGGGQETDDVRSVAIEPPHLSQAGERLVRSTPLGIAEQSTTTASSRERRAARSTRDRGEGACGIFHGSSDEPNAEGFPIPTRDDGGVDGGGADGLGEAFERFKHGPGRDTNDRLQDVKAAVKRGRALVNEISGRLNGAKGRIDHARAQLQWEEDDGGARLHPSSNCSNQSVVTHSPCALRSASPPDVALFEGTRQIEAGERRSGGGEENNRQKLLLLAAQLREEKREYRGLFEKLAKAKAALRGFRQKKQQALSTLVTEFQKEQQESRRKSDFFLPPLSGIDQGDGETTTTTDGYGAGGDQGGRASAVTTPTKTPPTATAAAAAALVQRAASS